MNVTTSGGKEETGKTAAVPVRSGNIQISTAPQKVTVGLVLPGSAAGQCLLSRLEVGTRECGPQRGICYLEHTHCLLHTLGNIRMKTSR